MTTDPSATDPAPQDGDPTDGQTDSLPDNNPSATEQIRSVDVTAFTEHGDAAETSAFLDEGEYSGGDFAGGEVERNG